MKSSESQLAGLLEPWGVMYYRHHATIQHTPQTEALCHRNTHLFFWKNPPDSVLIAKHIDRLALRVAWRAVWFYLRGLWAASHQLPQALKRRQPMKPLWARTDAEVWALTHRTGPPTFPQPDGRPG